MPSIPYSRYIIYPVPWYSFLIVLGASIAIFIASRGEKRAGLKKDTIIDLALWLLPFGIIGARIYYVVFSWDQFRQHSLSILRIWEGGLAIYGGILAGLIVLFVFCRKRSIQPLLLCDVIVPGLAIAQSIGRWGNYFNIEAYGAVMHNPSLCFFPLAVEVPTASGTEWHMAAFFYESVLDFAVFLFLMTRGQKLKRKPGDLFFFYLILYAAGRLIIEDIRTDSLYAVSSVRISQLLSILLCLFVLLRYSLPLFRRINGPPASAVAAASVSFLFTLAIILFVCVPSALDGFSSGKRLIILSVYSLTIVVSFFWFFHMNVLEDDHADNQS